MAMKFSDGLSLSSMLHTPLLQQFWSVIIVIHEKRAVSAVILRSTFLPWWTRKGWGKIKNIWIKNRWHKNSFLTYSHNNLRLSESYCLCVSLWANADLCLQWVWAAWWITEEAVTATEWGSRLTDCNMESPIQMTPRGSSSYIVVWSLVNCKHPFCIWISFDIRFSVISGRDPISELLLLLLWFQGFLCTPGWYLNRNILLLNKWIKMSDFCDRTGKLVYNWVNAIQAHSAVQGKKIKMHITAAEQGNRI